MATTKKKLNKAFISAGKVKDPVTKVESEEFIAISEDLAKFIGAKYSTTAPKPKQIKTKINGKERTIERQHSVSITGRKYQVGYVKSSSRKQGKKRVTQIKWVPIHCPYGMNTRQFIANVVAKLSKRPVQLKTPDGIVVPLSFSK